MFVLLLALETGLFYQPRAVQLAGIREECRERAAGGKPTQNVLAEGREYPCVVKKHPGAELCISHIVGICRMALLNCGPSDVILYRKL